MTPRDLSATLFARLPPDLHHTGEPTDWVRVTRPGQRLHSFLEGPCFDGAGHLWLVDVPYGRIFRVDPDGGWTLAHAYAGEPHGLARLGDGAFAVTDYRRGVLRLGSDGTMTPLVTGVNTEAFRGLGDITRGPDGSLWFTDPGRSSLTDPTGRLFRLRPGATSAEPVLINIPYPNGVALSPDGKLVHIAVTRANAVWRLLADAPDPLLPMTGVFLNLSGGLGPDGLAIDRHGRLAVAQAQAGRALVFDRLGDPLARIVLPEGRWTTSVAFAPDADVLFIVEAETASIYRADLSDLPATAF
ncbi:SMP-30/gluconolactonase/LRE family protein [Roseomonas sp. CAU 1739]|uniref:SMP-30/gluconolactonase/LRE family protein n=1 Tax=Roseomonas sp. CAU 1739 TaxID=3140364 RepID=UPI00325BD226